MSDPTKPVDGQTSAPDDKPLLLKRLHGLVTTYLKPEFLSALVLLSELFGGLVFFAYILHIRFMPELDATGFVTLLAAFALTGAFLLLALGLLLIAPALAWKYTTKGEESLKSFWWFGWVGLFFILGSFLYWFLYDLHKPRWWPTIVVWSVGGIALPLVLLLFNKPWHWIVRFLATPMCPLHRKQSKDASDSATLLLNRGWKQKKSAAWFFFKACFWSAVQILLLLPIVTIILEDATPGLYQRTPVLFTMQAMLLIVMIFVWNTVAIRVARSLADFAKIAAVLMVALFFVLPLGTFISSRVVRILKFGEFKASLVLDETGCAIAREDHLIPAAEENKATAATSKTCSLPDVTILSRLGTSYYLRYHTSTDKDSVCFTVPGHDVLSWTVQPTSPDPPCQYQLGAPPAR